MCTRRSKILHGESEGNELGALIKNRHRHIFRGIRWVHETLHAKLLTHLISNYFLPQTSRVANLFYRSTVRLSLFLLTIECKIYKSIKLNNHLRVETTLSVRFK